MIELQLLLEIIDKASAQLSGVRQELVDVDKGADSAESGLRRIDDSMRQTGQGATSFGKQMQTAWWQVTTGINEAIGIAREVTRVVQAAFDTLNEGAQLIQLNRQFETVATGIGSSGRVLLAGLREVAQGAATDAELIGASVRLLGMNVIQTQDHLERVVNGVSRLKDPTESLSGSLENFGLLLANRSIKRLDEFKISSQEVQERLHAMGAASAQSATDGQFLEAVLAEMDASMTRLGTSAGSTVSDIDRLHAQLGNLQNGFSVALYQGMEPLINAAVEFVNSHGPELTAALTTVANATVALGQPLASVGHAINRDFVEPWRQATEHTGNLADMGFDQMLDELTALEIQTNSLERQLKALGIPVSDLRDYFGQLQDEYDGGFMEVGGDVAALRVYLSYLQSIMQQMSGDDMPALTDAIMDYAKANHLAREYAEDISGALDVVGSTAVRLTANWQHTTVSLDTASAALATWNDRVSATIDLMRGEFITQVQAGDGATFDLAGNLFNLAEQEGLTVGQTAALTGALTDYAPEAIDAALQSAYLAGALQEIVQKFKDGKLSADEARLAYETFEQRANAMDFSPLSAEIAALIGQVQALEGEHKIILTVEQRGEIPGAPDQGGQGPKDEQGNSGGSGGSGDDQYGQYALGGWTGSRGGFVHPYELVVPQETLTAGPGALLAFAERHTPGGIGGGGRPNATIAPQFGPANGGVTFIFNIDASGSLMSAEVWREIATAATAEALATAGLRAEASGRGY